MTVNTILFCAFAALAATFAHSTHVFAMSWSRDTQLRRDATLALVGELKKVAAQHTAANTRCVLRLSDDVNAQLNVDGFLDFTLKAHLAPSDPAARCIVVGKPPIATSFTRIMPCEKASFAPLRAIDDRLPAIGVGGVCKYFFLRE